MNESKIRMGKGRKKGKNEKYSEGRIKKKMKRSRGKNGQKRPRQKKS